MGSYYVGTAGWSYEDWEGIVYPPGKGRGFHPLPYLAPFIDIIEINSTFYRPATPALALSWTRRVQAYPSFLFAVKLHQAFTHGGREYGPRDVEGFRAAIDILRLKGRLAALLIQFPWSFVNTPANTEYLLRLFRHFPGFPLALEVRHATWDTPEFFELLGENKVCFCNIDQPLFANSIKPSAVVTHPEFSYVRLHGRNHKNWFRADAGRDDRYDYLYSKDELEEWTDRIKQLGRKSGKVYVITNNHYRGQAMANALQIRNMVTGEKVDIPQILLEKFPVLREIARKIGAGQMDLFEAPGRAGPDDEEKSGP